MQRIDALDELRIERTLISDVQGFQHVFQLLTLLIHYNHPNLPAYVEDAPQGIWQFSPTTYQQNYLAQINKNFGSDTSVHFDAVYAMGSTGSISQTSHSDLDIWVCSEYPFSLQQESLIQSKFNLLTKWASEFNVEIHFYLMNPKQFKNQFYYNKVSRENSGSAQHFFLLDEFYRSAIRLSGKRLLWLHLLKEDDQTYQDAIDVAVAQGLELSDWIDFGDFSALSLDEFFGASLWQLYKSINSPYKSALKILLLETYTQNYNEINLISKQFKRYLLEGEGQENYHFDPYIAMFERVTAYLIAQNDLQRLKKIRRCFYIKITDGISKNSWRFEQAQKLVTEWGWSESQRDDLINRNNWKIKQAIEHQQELVDLFIKSYHQLVDFAKKQNIEPNILSQDSDILMRQLYSTFEVLPNKVPLLNNKIKWNLAEDDLTFIESNGNSFFEKGWYLVNYAPRTVNDSKNRYVQYFPTLIQLVAWAYFNGLVTPKTRLHIVSKSVSLTTLRQFITDLRLHIPVKAPLPSSEAWHHPNEIRHLVVVVNLTKDLTKKQQVNVKNLSSKELFNLGKGAQNIVGSIGLIYRNMWNEIRTEYFEGESAVFDALKLLSNKLYQNNFAPHLLNLFCYSAHFNSELKKLITSLINRCIVVQTGINYQKQLLIRSDISTKRWQSIFENLEKDDVQAEGFIANFTENVNNVTNYSLPNEIGQFAIEGFIQFFFEDRENEKFNVYVLDEKNHLETYCNCIGSKNKKVKLINATYAEQKAQKVTFSFPQFYQIVEKNGKMQIELFEISHNFVK
ncbi:MAG: class I adenylate cyclase [Pasteurella sp.]|nr:class I adenylate cyclase [Pasteurella sp.]